MTSYYKELKKTPHPKFLEAGLDSYLKYKNSNSCTAIENGVWSEAKKPQYGLNPRQMKAISNFYRVQYNEYAKEVGKPHWWAYSDKTDEVIPQKVEFIKSFIEYFTKSGKWLVVHRD